MVLLMFALPQPYCYSELTKTSTALARLAVLFVLSAARRLVLIFVNSLYFVEASFSGSLFHSFPQPCRLLPQKNR